MTGGEGRAELRSFDVFDTVLTRLVARPGSLFLLVGQRAVRAGHWPHSAQQFAAARAAAEGRARAHLHPGEVTLQGIYQELAFAHDLPAAAVQGCAMLEIELEGATLRAVPAARRAVDAAREAGHRIAFISDIYLPADVIRGWLEREGLATPSDAVWVSSEAGATKASGALFERVRRAGPAPTRWHHVGDHPRSDVSVPRAQGIDATLWDACGLTRYEEAMERDASATGGLSSLLAGASRWLRLSHPVETPEQAGLRDIVAGVAGPVLWSFVAWVLQRARREGLRRIWFTARDGQVMLRMARRIAPRLGIDVELGYLYGGRQVVHLAGLHRIDDRAIGWLTGGVGVVTAAALLERVGLGVADLRDALQRHGIPLDGPIGWERMNAAQAFFRDPEVGTVVLAMAARRRADMRSYFGACGLMDGAPCAIVDIGWRGSVLRSMFDIIGAENGARHQFLYFGLYGRPRDVPEARMAAYCFDLSVAPGLGAAHDVPALTAVMEIICQADHGQVIHVEPQGDAHVPRLRPPPATLPTQWDVPCVQGCLEAFADAVQIDLAVDPDADLRPLCERVLRLLMATPSPQEAALLGSVQFIDDQGGTTSQPFAHAYVAGDWRAMVRNGALPSKTMAWWEQGAWTLTPPRVRWWLRAARRLGRPLRRAPAAAASVEITRHGTA